MEKKPGIAGLIGKLICSAILLTLAIAVAVPAFAWFGRQAIGAYAPISSHESLYIGAGHIAIDVENDVFDPDILLEDVRYLYLNGIDATDGTEYQDYVFCVYGKAISRFKLQLAYTTNNQFTYAIYNATEASVDSVGAVRYDTHDPDHPNTYYYSATGAAISGSYLNKTTAGDGKTIADASKHTATYGSYSTSYVNRFAEPIYWQTSSAITGDASHAFAKYFILRVYKNDKASNDRETDVICIAAKSSTS